MQATVDDKSVNVSLLDASLCKDARFGHMVAHETREASPSALSYLSWEVVTLATMGAGIELLAKAPTNALDEPANSYEIPGIILMSVGFSASAVIPFIATPWFLSHKKFESRDIPGEAASQWTGDSAAPCHDGAASGARATIGLSATFERGSQAIRWHLDTDDSGQTSFAVRAQLEGIANYCGPATVTVSESRADPGEYSYDGEPMSPTIRQRPAPQINVAVNGGQGLALDDLPGFAKTLAQECKADRLSTCTRRMTQEMRNGFQQSCEEECGEKVDAMQCVFARRNCVAQTDGSESERDICSNGYRQCLIEANVKPDSLDACVDKCVDGKKTAACL